MMICKLKLGGRAGFHKPGGHGDGLDREDLQELHFITPIENLPSILVHGIVCHDRADALTAASVAMTEIQDIRAGKSVPGGLRLHAYCNLYVCARNPMLRKRKSVHTMICVLRVSPDVLDIPGTVVTDQNAASKYVRFAAAPAGLGIVDKDRTFADHWTHPDDQVDEWRHKAQKCAEVLVPDAVPPNYLFGVYASNDASAGQIRARGFPHQVTVDPHLFFL